MGLEDLFLEVNAGGRLITLELNSVPYSKVNREHSKVNNNKK